MNTKKVVGLAALLTMATCTVKAEEFALNRVNAKDLVPVRTVAFAPQSVMVGDRFVDEASIDDAIKEAVAKTVEPENALLKKRLELLLAKGTFHEKAQLVLWNSANGTYSFPRRLTSTQKGWVDDAERKVCRAVTRTFCWMSCTWEADGAEKHKVCNKECETTLVNPCDN